VCPEKQRGRISGKVDRAAEADDHKAIEGTIQATFHCDLGAFP